MEIKKLSATVAKEFGQLRAQLAALKEEEKDACERIKKLMGDEDLAEYAPESSPYKLVFSEHERTSVSWKDEWQCLAKERYGKSWKKEMDRVINEAGSSTIQVLNVEPNEYYNE